MNDHVVTSIDSISHSEIVFTFLLSKNEWLYGTRHQIRCSPAPAGYPN